VAILAASAARGSFVFFDRSWYGRVLVERVEGFCTEAGWMRAYSEINDFEQAIVRHGIVIAKFWLAITKAEQLRRSREREKVSFKRFKITEEDWRNPRSGTPMSLQSVTWWTAPRLPQHPGRWSRPITSIMRASRSCRCGAVENALERVSKKGKNKRT
jgi:hypothetical protein